MTRLVNQTARLALSDAEAARRHMESGLAHAARALAMDSTDLDAVELRGTLRYLSWLTRLDAGLNLLARYLAMNPHLRESTMHSTSWWLADLRKDARYRTMFR